MSENGPMRHIADALYERRCQSYWGFTVAVTTECRKDLLRQVGFDPETPATTPETVFGERMVVDDAIPADPGFEVRVHE